MKMFIISLLLWAVQYSIQAALVGDTRITGRLLKYDKTTVTLSQYGNRRVTLPRSNVQKDFKKLKTGSVVTVVFSAEEMMSMMSKIKKQSKTK